MDPKVYEIAGVKCRLSLDQTLREMNEVNEFFRTSDGKRTIEQTERFLQIVLKAEEPVEYLDMKESVFAQIITDYQIQKKNWIEATSNALLNSALEANLSHQKFSGSAGEAVDS